MYESLSTVLRRTKNKTFIGEGSCRKVYDLQNGYILKVAKNKKGLKECANEHFIFHHVPKEIQEFLCPVIQYEGKYILMPKIEPLPSEKEVDTTRGASVVVDYLRENYDIDEFELSFGFNWGKYKQRLVLLDYGHTYFDNFVEDFALL